MPENGDGIGRDVPYIDPALPMALYLPGQRAEVGVVGGLPADGTETLWLAPVTRWVNHEADSFHHFATMEEWLTNPPWVWARNKEKPLWVDPLVAEVQTLWTGSLNDYIARQTDRNTCPC